MCGLEKIAWTVAWCFVGFASGLIDIVCDLVCNHKNVRIKSIVYVFFATIFGPISWIIIFSSIPECFGYKYYCKKSWVFKFFILLFKVVSCVIKFIFTGRLFVWVWSLKEITIIKAKDTVNQGGVDE